MILAKTKAAIQRALQARGFEVRRDAQGKRIFARNLQTKEVFGYQMKLNCLEDIQRSISLNNFEIAETKWVTDYLRPGMTFVDVGANVGYFSLLAARQVGSCGRVLAFEPSPVAFAALEETIRLNQIGQITAENLACGEQCGSLSLNLYEESCHSPSLVPSPHSTVELGSVDVIRLDDYCANHQIEHIDLIKIDVEGFEPEVLRGLSDLFARGAVAAILCELNPHWLKLKNETVAELNDLICGFGFVVDKTISYEGSHEDIFYIKKSP